MADLDNKLMTLLSTDIFKSLLNSDEFEIAKLNTAIALLIKAGIPFELTFTPGTRRDAATATLTVYINPATSIKFTITFNSFCR